MRQNEEEKRQSKEITRWNKKRKKTYKAVQKEKRQHEANRLQHEAAMAAQCETHSHEDASYREKQLELDERLRLKDIESRETFDRGKIAPTLKTKQWDQKINMTWN